MRKSQIIALVVIIVMLIPSVIILCDFLNWKNATNVLKENIPTAGTSVPYKWINGFGYVPLVSFGNIQAIIKIKANSNESIVQPYQINYWLKLDGDAAFSDGFVNNDFIATHPRPEGNYNWQQIECYVAYVEIGEKIYTQKYVGEKAVDYPITREIVNQYKDYIFADVSDPAKIEEYTNFLLTFTHDSLNVFINSFYPSKVQQLSSAPNIYAYRLNEFTSGRVKFEKVYEKVWTGQCRGKLLLVYSVDGNMKFKWFKDPYFISTCGGSAWSFKDWEWFD
jgi:hypothetical protein